MSLITSCLSYSISLLLRITFLFWNQTLSCMFSIENILRSVQRSAWVNEPLMWTYTYYWDLLRSASCTPVKWHSWAIIWKESRSLLGLELFFRFSFLESNWNHSQLCGFIRFVHLTQTGSKNRGHKFMRKYNKIYFMEIELKSQKCKYLLPLGCESKERKGV